MVTTNGKSYQNLIQKEAISETVRITDTADGHTVECSLSDFLESNALDAQEVDRLNKGEILDMGGGAALHVQVQLITPEVHPHSHACMTKYLLSGDPRCPACGFAIGIDEVKERHRLEHMNTMNEIKTSRARRKDAVDALNDAFRDNGHAAAYLLDGEWYIVTTGTGEGCFAYEVESVDADAINAAIDSGTWDYSTWCNESDSPVTDKNVAVALYLETGLLLCQAGACNAILTDAETSVLDIVRGIKG